MEIGKSIRFIPQQRQWPGGCAPPRSRPGAHPEGPAAARHKKTPATPEALLPAPRYTRRAWQCICLQFELTAQLASADANPAGMAATDRIPTAVAGTCMCVRRWPRAGRPARPPAHTGTSAKR